MEADFQALIEEANRNMKEEEEEDSPPPSLELQEKSHKPIRIVKVSTHEEYKELREMSYQARRKELFKIMSVVQKHDLLENPLPHESVYVAKYKMIMEDQEQTREQKQRKNGNPLSMFITLRPKEGACTFATFYSFVSKWTTQKYVVGAFTLTFEQSSANLDSMGKGFHCHCLLRTTTTRSDIMKRVRNTFKRIIPDFHGIDFKDLHTPDDEIRVSDYIRGLKSSSEKLDKVAIDRLWREKLDLLPYYSEDSLPPKTF